MLFCMTICVFVYMLARVPTNMFVNIWSDCCLGNLSVPVGRRPVCLRRSVPVAGNIIFVSVLVGALLSMTLCVVVCVVVSEFAGVCWRRKLKVKASKSKVMVVSKSGENKVDIQL